MLDRNDFIAKGKETLARRTFPNAKEYIIRSSSGTSGKEPVVHIRPASTHKTADLRYAGKRLLLATGSLNIQLLHTLQIYKENGGFFEEILSLAESDLGGDLDRVIGDFAPDIVKGSPSFLTRILECVREESLSNVAVVQASAEYLTEATEGVIRAKMKNAALRSTYSTSEAGVVGQSCHIFRRNRYHPLQGVIIKILEPDEEGVGDVVVTTSLVKNYKTGDAGRLLTEPCQCGAGQTLKIVGRTNFDFIRLLGATLYQEEFERVALELEEEIVEYRVAARERQIGEKMLGEVSVDIVPTKKLSQRKGGLTFIADQISRRVFLTPSRTHAALVRDEIFLPLLVRFVADFPPQAKNAKLRLMID